MKRFIFYCKQCGFEYSGPNENPLACSYCGTVNDLNCVEEYGIQCQNMGMKIKKKCLSCGCEFSVSPLVMQDFCNRCYPVVAKEIFDRNNDNLTVEQLKNKIKEKLNKKI